MSVFIAFPGMSIMSCKSIKPFDLMVIHVLKCVQSIFSYKQETSFHYPPETSIKLLILDMHFLHILH